MFADAVFWMLLANLFVSLVSLSQKTTVVPNNSRLERKLDLILKHLQIEVDEGSDEEIWALLRSGQKIQAIKLYRERTGVGLKEAKDYVEQLEG